MSVRWCERDHDQDPLIFGNVKRRFRSYRAIVSDEPIGSFTDNDNIEAYGGYLICESVASNEIGEVIIRAMNEAWKAGEVW